MLSHSTIAAAKVGMNFTRASAQCKQAAAAAANQQSKRHC
jgi:hypothetical protein